MTSDGRPMTGQDVAEDGAGLAALVFARFDEARLALLPLEEQ